MNKKIFIVLIATLLLTGCVETVPPQMVIFLSKMFNYFFGACYIAIALSFILKKFNLVFAGLFILLALYTSHFLLSTYYSGPFLKLYIPFLN
ncbi:hypothetical protein ABBZ21_19790 [Acinetobacter baumannii]|uniref:hypothetical protein n=1 Tax=Acinetobacter baumannii TaxID=470 RepID=UPI00385F379A